jgi:hypothetical protein
MAVRRKRIPAGQLSIDRRVQRHGLNETVLNDIREHFSPDALSTLEVSERPDKTYVILDGQHRWEVAKELKGDEYNLDCVVHTGLSLGEEAALFLRLNKQVPPNAVDKFYVSVTQEDPAALAVKEAVEAQGWTVGRGRGEISAVGTLLTTFKTGEKIEEGFGKTLLHNTLFVIAAAWGTEDTKAVDKNIIGALVQFFLRIDKYEDNRDVDLALDHDKLATNLNTYVKNGPGGWLSSCRGMAAGTSKTVRKVLIQELMDIYNKGKGGRKLPNDLLIAKL